MNAPDTSQDGHESRQLEFRRALEADRVRTQAVIDSLTAAFTGIVDSAALSATDDEHDPEGATIAFERSQTSALLASARDRLVELDAALARLADGRYGRCEGCGRQIALGRLRARPSARECITCAGRRPGGSSPTRTVG